MISLVGIVGFSYVSKKSPVTACHEWGFSQAEKYYAYPEKIVVEPWRGRHHVYGIFQIPGGYLNDKLLQVEIPGSGTYCGILSYGGTVATDGVYAKPGHYLMKGMLNTRIAIKLIFKGKQQELQQLNKWKLGYTKIEEH
ncbi:hypothetical protein [Rivularia sp. UHCC 0363]|uniref:hypothetical protein n=1 Tax=Rivularia sp. UHCC 0363 TaxID=3110244 RepID=UPI002B1ED47E|nr:hypothetical protein [Rivularia sp. UHCC 0363]MEA5598976.1 hypothetical protein [Rivularia sp. UHCC 0363]